MNHAPATELPGDDEPWWSTVAEFTRQSIELERVGDWAAAERLARDYFECAESAYAAAVYTRSRANALAWLGRDAQSLEADELAERLVPVEPHFKLNLARRLIAEFGRPEDGLTKIAEAEQLLEPNARVVCLGEKGLGLLALGRDAEAVECFRELTRPERLRSMREWNYIGLVDFRLVSGLIERRLVPALCVAYLEVAEAIGERHNPDSLDTDTAHKLLAQARSAGT